MKIFNLELGKKKVSFSVGIPYVVFALATGMIGKTINNSTAWGIFDFFFAPFAWMKWFLYHDVCISIIKQTFEFFLK